MKKIYEKPVLTKRDRLSTVTAASGPSTTPPLG
ncbi:putative RiPP precursor [Mesorhizobium sp. B2-1-3A]|nr:putative RiPP precursor [Mesorhizobium sp. B2-1-3A]TPM97933.1 putative RiPP precursor [Mesorhizobium sp. B2-1-3A]